MCQTKRKAGVRKLARWLNMVAVDVHLRVETVSVNFPALGLALYQSLDLSFVQCICSSSIIALTLLMASVAFGLAAV